MRKMIITIVTVILTIIAFLYTKATASGQTINHPLPELILHLSHEDYTAWARWQNRQAERRAKEIANHTKGMEYNYIKRVISKSFSQGSTNTRISGSSDSTNDSSTRSGTRNSQADTNFNQIGSTSIALYQDRYRNPFYVGAGPVTVYNPWTRPTGGFGTPDWDNLFIPCETGTITMREVLDRLVGPQKPEKIFKIMMEGYFGK